MLPEQQRAPEAQELQASALPPPQVLAAATLQEQPQEQEREVRAQRKLQESEPVSYAPPLE